MNTSYLIIALSTAVLVSYGFDLLSSRFRTPPLLLLLLMGEAASEQRSYLRFETSNHVSYGVLPYMYENLLYAVRDTVRSVVGPEWTPGMEGAWSERLALLLSEIHEVAAEVP